MRDGGPNSRAQLGDQVDLSRSKLAVEVDRLLETGLVVADGLAASRGGRRSHNIRLAPALRFLGVDIGATSVDVAVTNAELEILGHLNQPMDVREGPVAVFEQVLAMAAKLRASGLAEGFDGAGIGVPGPVRFPEGVPGRTADHAGLGRLPRAGGAQPGTRLPGHGRQRREPHGDGGAARGRRPLRRATSSASRSAPASAAASSSAVRSTAVRRAARATSGTSRPCPTAAPAPAATRAAWRPTSAARPSPGTPRRRPSSGRSAELAARLETNGGLTAVDVAAAAAAGDATALELIREGGNRIGQVIAGLVSFFNPGLVVIGGGVTGLGHTLLAAIRTQVYRQSLPLATGNLPIVLGELGPAAGVIGAARLISDHLFSPA